LFSDRGLSAVSVRDIAKGAQVNHGLVHRHFGAKARLTAAVMGRLRDDIGATLGPEVSGEGLGELVLLALSSMQRQRPLWRIIAHASMEGALPEEMDAGFETFRRVLRAARDHRLGPLGPEAQVTLLMSIGLGLITFGPYIRAATGQDAAKWRDTLRQIEQLIQLSVWASTPGAPNPAAPNPAASAAGPSTPGATPR